ncbi:hypothetical protein HJ588_10040 [Flexivirga sp. ID2601S]|uniref:PucR family transcriptional regulator n=1 Tax=Flexivirga aerilata TaxID=1656889 RepID=A0A849AGT4_9MICO|nr:hypothetical protein [Flexivirga aerilata]NNG39609.1 hypothetical protein [Flexivirga aerilata]
MGGPVQELVGRLTALDPDASETLKVVSYFDALAAAGVGVDGLLRGAAALSGVVAGAERHGRVTRRGPDGRDIGPEAEHSTQQATSVGSVWLERHGAPHANDAMIVERLAVSVDLVEARHRPVAHLETVIDADRSADERSTALAPLRLTPSSWMRLIATRPETQAPTGYSAVVPTRYGLIRATLQIADSPATVEPAGLGPWARADHAPESWAGAVVALGLADAADPVVDATDLGAMLTLAQAHDPEAPHPDVTALARLDPRSLQILRTLVEADSLRRAATTLGIHHSTLQARHEALTRSLGYDPRTAIGKIRFAAAAMLLRLNNFRDAHPAD